MTDGQHVKSVRPSKFVTISIFAVQKFMMKLFGGLIPGILFLVGASSSIIPATYLIVCFASGVKPLSLMKFGGDFFSVLNNTPSTIWLPVFGFIVTLAYVVGHLFYRRDPEKLDTSSIKKQSKKADFPAKKIKYRVIKLREELVCYEKTENEVSYPTGNEIIDRNALCHICAHILSKDSNHRQYRKTKFINKMKLHIKYHFPELYPRIIRNEARIQLTSSLWHVSYTLRVFCIIGFVLVLTTFSLMHGFDFNEAYLPYTTFICPQIFVFIVSEYMRVRVEKIIHDQRLDEEVFILETAHSLLRESPQYLRPTFWEQIKEHSRQDRRPPVSDKANR